MAVAAAGLFSEVAAEKLWQHGGYLVSEAGTMGALAPWMLREDGGGAAWTQ